jgi:hypothetical protein
MYVTEQRTMEDFEMDGAGLRNDVRSLRVSRFFLQGSRCAKRCRQVADNTRGQLDLVTSSSDIDPKTTNWPYLATHVDETKFAEQRHL